MDLSKQILREMLGSYLQTTLSQLLPELLTESLRDNDLFVGQEFVSLEGDIFYDKGSLPERYHGGAFIAQQWFMEPI